MAMRPLGAASAAYLEYMERVGRNRSYIGHVRRALLDLEEGVGDLPVGEITTEQLRDYLFGLPYGAVTIRNKRNYYLGAFGWWQKQGWAEDNPMSRVESPTGRMPRNTFRYSQESRICYHESSASRK